MNQFEPSGMVDGENGSEKLKIPIATARLGEVLMIPKQEPGGNIPYIIWGREPQASDEINNAFRSHDETLVQLQDKDGNNLRASSGVPKRAVHFSQTEGGSVNLRNPSTKHSFYYTLGFGTELKKVDPKSEINFPPNTTYKQLKIIFGQGYQMKPQDIELKQLESGRVVERINSFTFGTVLEQE